MTTHGYIGANIESILIKVGIPKGAFYYYFKSKEQVGNAILDYYSCFLLKIKTTSAKRKYFFSTLARIHTFCPDANISISKYQFNRRNLIGEQMQGKFLLPPNYSVLLNNILHN
jgi:AcrR family transcriptional regulator